VDRLEEELAREDLDTLGALHIAHEGGVRLDGVVIAGAQTQHSHVRIGDDLEAQIEARGLAPVVLVYLEEDVLSPVPLDEAVGAGSHGVRLHELVRFAGGHPSVLLDHFL
jgi:hypothetical protein